MQPCAVEDERAALLFGDADAHGAQGGEGREVVLPHRSALDAAHPGGEASQEDRAVSDAFVTRDGNAAVKRRSSRMHEEVRHGSGLAEAATRGDPSARTPAVDVRSPRHGRGGFLLQLESFFFGQEGSFFGTKRPRSPEGLPSPRNHRLISWGRESSPPEANLAPPSAADRDPGIALQDRQKRPDFPRIGPTAGTRQARVLRRRGFRGEHGGSPAVEQARRPSDKLDLPLREAGGRGSALLAAALWLGGDEGFEAGYLLARECGARKPDREW
jgi:hypothetical protein